MCGRTYRKHSQQRRFARILQAYHGDVHLRRPTSLKVSLKERERERERRVSEGDDLVYDLSNLPRPPRTWQVRPCSAAQACTSTEGLKPTHQKVLNSQSYTFRTSCAIMYFCPLSTRGVRGEGRESVWSVCVRRPEAQARFRRARGMLAAGKVGSLVIQGRALGYGA